MVEDFSVALFGISHVYLLAIGRLGGGCSAVSCT